MLRARSRSGAFLASLSVVLALAGVCAGVAGLRGLHLLFEQEIHAGQARADEVGNIAAGLAALRQIEDHGVVHIGQAPEGFEIPQCRCGVYG